MLIGPSPHHCSPIGCAPLHSTSFIFRRGGCCRTRLKRRLQRKISGSLVSASLHGHVVSHHVTYHAVDYFAHSRLSAFGNRSFPWVIKLFKYMFFEKITASAWILSTYWRQNERKVQLFRRICRFRRAKHIFCVRHMVIYNFYFRLFFRPCTLCKYQRWSIQALLLIFPWCTRL